MSLYRFWRTFVPAVSRHRKISNCLSLSFITVPFLFNHYFLSLCNARDLFLIMTLVPETEVARNSQTNKIPGIVTFLLAKTNQEQHEWCQNAMARPWTKKKKLWKIQGIFDLVTFQKIQVIKIVKSRDNKRYQRLPTYRWKYEWRQ